MDCLDNNEEECTFENFASGQNFPNLTLCMIDPYGQTLSLINGYAFIDLYPDQNLTKTFLTGTGAQIINGTAVFDSVSLVSFPNSSILVKITSDSIPYFLKDFLQANFFQRYDETTLQYYFLINIHLRLCEIGEIYDSIDNICLYCPKGFYSFNPSNNQCNQCPLNVQCNQGGDSLDLNFGYWRSNTSSDQIYQCNTVSNPCLGGYNSTCVLGYRGIQCSSCVSEKNIKYFRKGLYSCEECSSFWIYLVAIVLVLAVIFRIIFLLESDDEKVDKFSFILIKIITTHFQTLNVISILKLQLPNFINIYFSFQAPFSTADSVLSVFECFNFSSLSVYFLKILCSLAFALMVVVVITIFQFLLAYARKINLPTLKIKIMTTLVIAINFFQPWLINFYLQNITCDTFEGQDYLAFNMDQKCWQSTHLIVSLLITIPLLIFLMLIYPLVIYQYFF